VAHLPPFEYWLQPLSKVSPSSPGRNLAWGVRPPATGVPPVLLKTEKVFVEAHPSGKVIRFEYPYLVINDEWKQKVLLCILL
jgi:hypothetical protein